MLRNMLYTVLWENVRTSLKSTSLCIAAVFFQCFKVEHKHTSFLLNEVLIR